MERDTPSPERLRRALRAGDSPLSRAALRAATLAVMVSFAPAAARALQGRFTERLHAAIATPTSATPAMLAADVAALAGPILLIAFVVAIVLGLAQTGGAVAWKGTSRERNGAGAGLGRLWNGDRAVDAARGVAVVSVLAVAVVLVLARTAPEFARATEKPDSALAVACAAALSAARVIAVAALVFGVIDVVVQRARFAGRWSLSPSEAKRERRDDEGDPELKRARRRAYDSP